MQLHNSETAASQAMTPSPGSPPSLEQIALDYANGDIPAAIEHMATSVLSDSEFLAEHIQDIVKAWAELRIRSKVSAWRHRITTVSPIGQGRGSFAENLAVAIKAEATRFMNMPLFGGKQIGHATVDEIRESASRYGLVADDMKRKQRWQNLVADVLSERGGGVVSDAMSEDDLSELWNKLN